MRFSKFSGSLLLLSFNFFILSTLFLMFQGCSTDSSANLEKIPLADPGLVTKLQAGFQKEKQSLLNKTALRTNEKRQGAKEEELHLLSGNIEWHSFQGDIGNTGASNAEYSGTTIEKVWEFDLGDHAWEYSSEMASWSMSAVYAKLKSRDNNMDNREMLFIGCHDRNFYALDAKTGALVWQRPLGGLVMSAPLFLARANAVVASCSDRSIYCLTADTGKILWSSELAPWSETVEPAVTGSPMVWENKKSGSDLNGFLAVTIFHSDKAFLKSVQQGMVLLLDPDTGRIMKKRIISASPLSSPCLGIYGDNAVLYTADRGGCIYALSMPDLKLLWKKVLTGRVFSSPSLFFDENRPVVCISDMYGMISMFNGITGEPVWSVKTGFFLNTTPGIRGEGTILNINRQSNLHVKKPRIYVGGFDRMVHAFDIEKKKKIFSFGTQKYVSSNLFSCKINMRDAIIFSSLDRKLYALDAETGKELFRHDTDDMLWSHEKPGQTVWPGPVPAGDLIILPTPGNRIMAFRIK